MKTTKWTIAVAATFMTLRSQAQMPPDVVPVSKLSKQELINVINVIGHEVVIAADVNVVHDAQSKSIRIFTTKTDGEKAPFKVAGYQVEVIYNPHMEAKKAGVDSYRCQHNYAVLVFAAAKFASGEKDLGLSLMRLLADAEPDLFWSTPNQVIRIDQILKGFIKDDGSLKDFLNEMREDWKGIVREYGPYGP